MLKTKLLILIAILSSNCHGMESFDPELKEEAISTVTIRNTILDIRLDLISEVNSLNSQAIRMEPTNPSKTLLIKRIEQLSKQIAAIDAETEEFIIRCNTPTDEENY